MNLASLLGVSAMFNLMHGIGLLPEQKVRIPKRYRNKTKYGVARKAKNKQARASRLRNRS
jgi:hypothetical protein